MVQIGDLDLVKNSKGRYIPRRLGTSLFEPYDNHLGIPPVMEREIGRKTRHNRLLDSKVLNSIEEAVRRTGLSDGMCISFHHHLRNGDHVVNMVMDVIHSMGIRDLKIAPTALFPVHEHIVPYIQDGTITSIEGSLNGPVGRFVSNGNMETPVILRSHSGRVRAIRQGELKIDIAFMAASGADVLGNANGVLGRSAFGPCSFLAADSYFADKTIIITDNLVPFPCTPISIPSTDVDYVVKIESIGDPKGILSGTVQITEDPMRLMIAETVMKIMEAGNLLMEGFSFQAGSGGISLALTKKIDEKFSAEEKVADYAVGGSTRFLVDMLKNGTLRKLLDGQSFDSTSIQSLKNNLDHVEVFVDQYSNLHSGGTITQLQDAAFLSATEVDTNFNINVNTHSDGYLLHGIGGHQDVAYGSRLTFVTIPLKRKNNPILRDEVVTITTPGELVDVVVTDKGISFNTINVRPEVMKRNEELERTCQKMGMNVLTIDEMRKIALEGVEEEMHPKTGNDVIAVIEYIDGTALDKVMNVVK